jgi:hypothetical protein
LLLWAYINSVKKKGRENIKQYTYDETRYEINLRNYMALWDICFR